MTTLQSNIARSAGAMILAAVINTAFSGMARADITVGVVLSLTGPAASLGKPAENTVKLWPDKIAGQKLKLVVLNDNSDSTEAAKLARKLITEDKVDVIVGSSITPPSIAIMEAAGRSETPLISLGGGNAIIEPQEGPRKWAFKMAAPEVLSVEKTIEHMTANRIKKVGVIAVTTSYGEGFLKAFSSAAQSKGISVVATERVGPQDVSVTSQALKLMASNPDAMYILSFGTPGATPHLELAKRGFRGVIYQTHGVANAEFLKIGGKDVEGAYLAVSPVLVAEQLPDGHPTKKAGLEYVTRYEKAYGPGTRSQFGSTAWTAMNWLEATVPVALKKGTPGSAEFRRALRDALEGMKEVVSPEGVFNMTATNHNGLDIRGQVMVKIEGGKWNLVHDAR